MKSFLLPLLRCQDHSRPSFSKSLILNIWIIIFSSISANAQTPVIAAGSNSPVCVGEMVFLDAQFTPSGTSTSITSWSWTVPTVPGGSSFTYTSNIEDPSGFIVTDAGTYVFQVEAEDNTGATNTASVTVVVNPASTIMTISDFTVCDQGIIDFSEAMLSSGTAISWNWTGPNGYTFGGADPTAFAATPAFDGTYTVEVTDGNGCKSTENVTITVNDLPSISATNDGPMCDMQTIELTGTSNASSPSWSWTGPGSLTDPMTITPELTASVSTTGVYSVTVTDGSTMCTATAITTVVVHPIPMVEATATSPICEGEDLELMAIFTSNGTSTSVANTSPWMWSGPNTFTSTLKDPSITSVDPITNAGTYMVTVTDNNGCEAEDDVTIIINDEPDLSVTTPLPICEGSALNLIADFTTNGTSTSVMSWSWTGPNNFSSTIEDPTIANASTAADGVYSVVVTDVNGCTKSDMITAIVYSMPMISVTTEPSCDGADIVLTPSFTSDGGNSISSWTWTYSDGTTVSGTGAIAVQTISSSSSSYQPGTYMLSVTDDRPCTNTTTVVVPAFNPTPMVSASALDVDVCEGEDIDLTATFTANGVSTSAMSWSWTGPNSFTSTMEDPTIMNVASANDGTYTVVVTDNNGCTETATVDVSVNPAPLVSAGGNTPVCLGDDLNLTGTFTPSPAPNTAMTWSWSGPNSFTSSMEDPSITGVTAAAAGLYTVTLTDNFGCSNTSDVTIEVSEPMLTVTSNSPVCIGEDIEFMVDYIDNGASSTANTWSWTGPNSFTSPLEDATNFSATTADAGTYTVMVTNSFGCTSMQTINIAVNTLPIANDLTLMACDDGSGTNAIYDLTDAEDPTASSNTNNIDVDDGTNSAVTVTYHTANPPVTGSTGNEISTPTAHSFAPGGTPIYALVTDANGCTAVATITLGIHPLPDAINTVLRLCDDGSGGATFDLTDAEDNTTASNIASGAGTDVDNGATGITVAYYTSTGSTGPITNSTAYTITSNTTVYAVITDGNDCTEEATVDLEIAPLLPTVAVTLQDCDDGDGIVNFNLEDAEDPNGTTNISGVEIDDNNGASNTLSSITYHTATPTSTANQITTQTAHAAQDGDVITAVMTTTDGCVTEATITIDFDEPVANDVTLLLCANGMTTVNFNLEDSEDPLAASNVAGGGGTGVDVDNGAGSGFTVSYETTGGTAIPTTGAAGAITTAYAASHGDQIVAIVTGPSGCTTEALITLNLTEPTANDVTLEECDDGTGGATFNLTDSESTTGTSNLNGIDVDNGVAGSTVTYYFPNTTVTGNQITTPAAYIATAGAVVKAVVTGPDGCTKEADITLTTRAAPTTNPVILELCDDGSGGATFDLTDAEDDTAASNTASGTGTDVDNGTANAVTYYTSSPSGGGTLIGGLTSYTASVGANTIYALVTDGTGCTAEQAITLTVNALPSTNTVTLRNCDDGDGIVTFDLTDAEGTSGSNISGVDIDAGDNGATVTSIDYYTSSTIVVGNLIPSSSAHSAQNGDVITAVLTDNNGCTSQATINIEVSDPVANALTLQMCDDLDGDGMVTFNLLDAENPNSASNSTGNGGTGIDVDGGTTNTVTYHTGSPAVLGAPTTGNEITSPGAFSVPITGMQVVALVTAPGNCASEAIITLNVSAPTTVDATLEVCETTVGSNVGVFDLTDSENASVATNTSATSVNNGTTNIVTYHTAATAGAGTIISNPTAYTSPSGGGTVWALVTGPDNCTAVAEVTLTVNALPVLDVPKLELCETTTGGGTAVFDLSEAETTGGSNTGAALVTSPTGATVDYYTASPSTGGTLISVPTAYTSASSTSVVAVVTDPATGCEVEAVIELVVDTGPTVNAVTLELCDDGDGMVDFDLTDANNSSAAGTSNISSMDVDDAGGNTVDYYTASPSAGGTAITGSTTPPNTAYPATNGTTVVAVITNTTTNCTNEAIITLNVIAPTANDVTLELCETTAGGNSAVFDLMDALNSTAASNMSGTDVDNGTSNMVDFFVTSGGTAITGTSVTAYTGAGGASIVAVVTDPTTNCTAEAVIDFVVNPLPTANAVTLEVCDDGTGSGLFDLTEAENSSATSNMTGTDVDDGTSNAVAYYTASPSSSGVLITGATAYTAANSSPIVAVVTDATTGCENEVNIFLTTKTSPAVNNVTLELCNDGTNSAIFDLTDADNSSGAGTSNISGVDVDNAGGNTVTYYTSSPSSGGTVISTPAVYSAMGGSTVVVVVTGTNGCFMEATVTLNLSEPVANDVTLELCDDGTGSAAFNLMDSENATATSNASGTDVDNTVNANIVTYHFANPGTSSNQISPTFTASNGTIVYAVVEDANTGCKNTAEITLNIVGPTANDITLVVCDDGDGTVDFDLMDAQNASVTSNQTGMTVDGGTGTSVTFHSGTTPTGTNLISITSGYSAMDGDMVTALVTDANGCTNTATITLNVPDPMVSAGSNLDICEGDDITLTSTFTANGNSTSAASWSWAGPNNYSATMEDPPAFASSSASAGTYTVTMTDNNGCTATATMMVAVKPAPMISAGTDIAVCEGDDIDLMGMFTTNSTSTSATTWAWTGPNSFTSSVQNPPTLTASSTTVGTYTLTVTDNQTCTSTATVTYELSVPMLSVSDITVCEGEDINLAATFTAGTVSSSAASWSWTGPNSFTSMVQNPPAFTSTATDAGTYIVVVTDNNGCTTTEMLMVTVNPPPILALNSQNIVACEGDTINLSATFTAGTISTAAVSWSWTGPNSFTSTVQNPPAIIVTTADAGTYTVVVTDNNNCTSTLSTTITVHPTPVINLVRDTCGLDLMFYSVELGLTPDDSIVSINTGSLVVVGVDSFIVGIASGTTVIVTAQDSITGCIGIDSLNIDCNCPMNIMAPDSISATFACPGDSSLFIVEVDSTETVDWYTATGGTPFAMGDSIWVTTAGSYFAVTRDTISQCESPDSTEMVFDFHPLPTATILSDTCDATFSTYSFTIVTSGDTILADTGAVAFIGASTTNDTFIVSGIPIDSSVILIAYDSLTGCSFTDTLMPPNCNCPILAAPILPNDTTLCSADSIPPVLAVVDTNQVVLWFSALAGGMNTPVDIGFTYIISASDTLFAQGWDTLTNCYSQIDTFIFLANGTPSLTFKDTICTADLDTFDLVVDLSDNLNDTLITNFGVITANNGLQYTISDIPSDSMLVLTVRDTMSDCETIYNMLINCNCLGNINPPMAVADTVRACPGDSMAMFVTVDSTETADWYNSGDTLLVMGDTMYATNMVGTYYVITRDTVSQCTSADTTAIVFENHPLPMPDTIYNNQGPYCASDTIRLIGDTLANVIYAWTSSDTATINDTTLQAPLITGASNGEIFTLVVTDTLTGCSNMIQDTVQIDSMPTITSIVTICDASLDSFTVQIFTDATTLIIMSAHGALAPGTNPYTIVGIPADSLLFLGLQFGSNSDCSIDTLIAAPNCNCPMVNPPTVVDTLFSCPGDTLPTLVAQVDSSETVDWYSTAGATGTALLLGDTLYTPTMLGTYYALTRDTITGCISDTTSAIVLANTTLPSFNAIASMDVCQGDSVTLLATSIVGATTWHWSTTGSGGIADTTLASTMAGGAMNGDQYILTGTDANGCVFTDTTNAVLVTVPSAPDTIYTECTPDLNNYIVYVVATGGTVTSDMGTITNVSVDTFQISVIPTSTNVTITFTDSTNCPYTQVITAPNCACPQTINAPTINNLTVCRDETPLLQAIVGLGETVNWFDTIVGGMTLATSPNYTALASASGTYTYYLQTVNTINGCVSVPRTPVTLTILPLPNPNLPAVSTVCTGDSVILTPGLFASYFWSTGDTTATISAGAGASGVTQYFVTVTDANGCSAVQVASVEEATIQSASLSLPAIACTADSMLTLTGGSPMGGTYTGPGVSGGVFDPVAAGVGTHTISYAVSGTCNGVATASIMVMSPGNAALSLANTTFCDTDTSITLTASPTGGVYSGTGASTNIFDPAVAGVGSHAIIYTLGAGTSCETADTVIVNVTTAPTVSLTLPMSALCNVSTPFTLTGGLPTGGTYSGPGVTGNMFDPVAAGAGTHAITYTVGGNCNVTATASMNVIFANATTLTLANTNFCETDGGIALSGSPAGGVYSGPGVSANVFDPALAGVGTHMLVYSIGTGTNCGMMASVIVSVVPAPTAIYTAPAATTVCNNTGAFTLSGGSPAGGTYSGTGVTNGAFDPAVAGMGTHTVTYTVTSGGCTSSAAINYTVVSPSSASLALGNASVCNNGGPVTLSGGSPAGGTYSGTAVSAGVFDPTGLGAGPYTITYTFSIGGGCTTSATATMNVLPSNSGVSFNLGSIQLCENAGLYTLGGGSPSGGTYSGTGVVGNTFNPTTAGPGVHMITYTGGSSTCFGTATSTISVISSNTTTSLNLSAPPLCDNSSPITLGGGSPAGGTFSGAGIDANGQFDPRISGAGIYTITYSSSCGSATDQIEVQPQLPVSLVLNQNAACSNEGSFALTGGSPGGGTFSGPGVSGNSFNPATVGPGNYTVTYTVNPGSGCTGAASATIVVTEPTTISTSLNLNVSAGLCASSTAFALSGGSPAGGTYSGPGVTGGVFDPSVAGAGIHTISYSVSGCTSGTSTATMIVEDNPPLPQFRMVSQVCEGENLSLEAVTIPGATSYLWTGPNGFSATTSNPIIPNATAAAAGRYDLIVMIGTCASAMNSIDVTVTDLPQAVSVSNNGPVCAGSNFMLQVDAPTQGDIYNWYYQNGAFIGTGTGLNLSSNDYQAGRYYVRVNRGNCEYNPVADANAPAFAYTDLTVSTLSSISANAGSDITICTDTYDLNPVLLNNQTLTGFWSVPLGSTARIMDPELFNTPVFNLAPGNNYFIWTLSNGGCTGISSDTVVVNYAAPPVLANDNFNTQFGESVTFDVLANDSFLFNGYFLDSIFSSNNGTAVINGDGTISYVPENTFAGTDQLTYRVCSNTCPTICTTATIGVDVLINRDVEKIILPNTITPNGDGMNDALIIPEVLEFPGSELLIFNRWGDEVYRSPDYKNDWDGFWQENSELLPVGTYFYVINLNDDNRTRMSGYVYVQRD